MNATTPVPRVEKITKLKSISTKPQSLTPGMSVNNKQNDSESTTEQDLIREDADKQTSSDRGRQSKILAEFSENYKIVNHTLGSKNLLARSAISISSDEIAGDDEQLNSEALIINVCNVDRID